MKLKKDKIYRVYWHDTVSIEEWANWESIEYKASECKQNQETIGFYIGSCHGYYVFCSTVNRSENMLPYANITLIPSGTIIKIKELR